jgi:sugar (pentulose or hexulose) kinase
MSDRDEIYLVQWVGEGLVAPYSADRLLWMIRRDPSLFRTIDTDFTVEKWVWDDEACDWKMSEDQ